MDQKENIGKQTNNPPASAPAPATTNALLMKFKALKNKENKEELASMDVEKKIINPLSASARKPTVNRNVIKDKVSKTPGGKPTKEFKFDPDCATGIPWIKPKKTTVPKPFKFASDQRAAIKKTTN